MAGHDRELRIARTEYAAAAKRLSDALRACGAARIPLDPGRGPEPVPWTRDHVRALRELQTALAEVIDKRRGWDAMRSEWQPPH